MVHSRKDVSLRFLREHFACQGIEEFDRLDSVTEEIHANRVLFIGGIDLDAIAAHTKVAALGRDLVARVLHRVETE